MRRTEPTTTVRTPALTPSAPTRRVCEAARMLGMNLDEHGSAPPIEARLPLRSGAVTLITGPSGAGKSTLLRAAAVAAREDGRRIIDPDSLRLRAAPIVDLFRAPLDESLRLLARAGLAEGRCFVRRPGELSDGQRRRLRLALAMHSAARRPSCPTMLVIDEFGAGLDGASARGVAAALRRAIDDSRNTGAIVATTRDDLAPALRPDCTIELDMTGAVRTNRRRESATDRFIIEPGSGADVKRLSHLHYRAARPARIVRTLIARESQSGVIAGAAVIAMPTLNAPWRRLAWPGRYDTGDKRLDARRMNDEIRRIARVIVDPRCRGVGLAARLVRAYLDDPLTPHTEAAAAMGRWHPFFERAGMTAYHTPPSERDARLLDALVHIGIEPWRLASPTTAWMRIEQSGAAALLHRELNRWANAAGSTRQHKADDPQHLFRIACAYAGATPVGYAHTSH